MSVRSVDIAYRSILIGSIVLFVYLLPFVAAALFWMLFIHASIGLLFKIVLYPREDIPPKNQMAVKFYFAWQVVPLLWDLPRHLRNLAKTDHSDKTP